MSPRPSASIQTELEKLMQKQRARAEAYERSEGVTALGTPFQLVILTEATAALNSLSIALVMSPPEATGK